MRALESRDESLLLKPGLPPAETKDAKGGKGGNQEGTIAELYEQDRAEFDRRRPRAMSMSGDMSYLFVVRTSAWYSLCSWIFAREPLGHFFPRESPVSVSLHHLPLRLLRQLQKLPTPLAGQLCQRALPPLGRSASRRRGLSKTSGSHRGVRHVQGLSNFLEANIVCHQSISELNEGHSRLVTRVVDRNVSVTLMCHTQGQKKRRRVYSQKNPRHLTQHTAFQPRPQRVPCRGRKVKDIGGCHV